MLKKLSFLLTIIVIGVASLAAPFALAQEAPHETCQDLVHIEVFERKDCAHCKAERAFLDDLQEERGDLLITYHDIAGKKHREHFNLLTELKNIPKVTPITIIGGVIMQGFDSEDTTGLKIRKLIEDSVGKKQYSFEEFIELGGNVHVENEEGTCIIEGEDVGCGVDDIDTWISIPFIGPVNVSKYSLPTLSIVLGFVDGFNPCAMWVLVLFLTILMEAGSRRRMFEMAGLFILAEAIMYYLILNVWMTAWDFVGLDNIVTPIVGFVAVAAGSFFLYKFYQADTACHVGSLETKRKTSEKIKYYATQPMTIITALGILGLAFSVNIIEFACSVGIPQTFTKILDMNYMSWGTKQIYNSLYILMYMVDDVIIFGIALYSFDRIGLTTHKYTRASHLIGGTLMVVLGLILLLNPSLLVFG